MKVSETPNYDSDCFLIALASNLQNIDGKYDTARKARMTTSIISFQSGDSGMPRASGVTFIQTLP